MEDFIFIEVLKYGAEKGLEGSDLKELLEWMAERKKAELTVIERSSLRNIFHECFDPPETATSKKSNLKTGYYFRLIEYRVLQEARASARSANRNAFIAIGISVFAIIISAVLTFTQLNTLTTINKSDLQALINSNAVQREVKLDSLQMAQILSAVGYNQTKPTVKKQKALPEGKEISHRELINKYYEE